MLLPAPVVAVLEKIQKRAVCHLPKVCDANDSQNFGWHQGMVCHAEAPQHRREQSADTVACVDRPAEAVSIGVARVTETVRHPDLAPSLERQSVAQWHVLEQTQRTKRALGELAQEGPAAPCDSLDVHKQGELRRIS